MFSRLASVKADFFNKMESGLTILSEYQLIWVENEIAIRLPKQDGSTILLDI